MPRATISTESVHKDLETLEGGFVDLRRMPYGKWLHRQELAMRMTIEAQSKGGRNSDVKGEMVMANKKVTVFEFSECIVDHNLEDDNGDPLDFKTLRALEVLDPKIGNEIGGYIMELHEFDSGNSSTGSVSSYTEV
jgi:hypothetical protein